MNPNSLLRHEREKRGWSQARMAELVGTDAGNVSRWERGFSAPSPYYRERLCQLFGREAQDLGFIVEDQETRRESQVLLEEPGPSLEVSQDQLRFAEVPSRTLRVLASASYLLGWITGLPILFFMGKKRFVLFHCLQSIFLFSGVIVLCSVFAGIVFVVSLDVVRVIASLLFLAMIVTVLAAWIIGIVTALMGRYYKLPMVGALSEKVMTALGAKDEKETMEEPLGNRRAPFDTFLNQS